MLTDSHCHLFDLKQYNSDFNEELKNTDIIVITSSTDFNEFLNNEELSGKNSRIYNSFAVHPQFLLKNQTMDTKPQTLIRNSMFNVPHLDILNKLAAEKRIIAVGECGFDLYNDEYKTTEKWQDGIFIQHLEIAIKHELPVILHVRRAMHKIFGHTAKLKKCKAVIFHSWPGTFEEGQSLLRRGVNAYFSFGNTILHGHMRQVRSCAHLPVERILTETDAPYQTQKGANFSSWKDLPEIINKISILRDADSQELEEQIKVNFFKGLGVRE